MLKLAPGKILPAPVYRLIRAWIVGLMTPILYGVNNGYYRSALSKSVVDRRGRAIPWMTYPLVTFLGTLSFEGRSVLEFGSGYSTEWWSARAEHVVALETDAGWLGRVRANVTSNVDVLPMTNGALRTPTDFLLYVQGIVGDRCFDVIVIDGGDRVSAAQVVSPLLTPDGFVIIDDLDIFDADPTWTVAFDSLRRAGFGRIDFYGLAAEAPFSRSRRCTSIFFRNGSFVTSRHASAVTSVCR